MATTTSARPRGIYVLGPDALTLTDAGEPVVPETSEDWLDWVAATKTRNYAIQDPLLDWLDLYGTAKGFQRDDELPGYDERCDFTRFVFRQAARFEAKAVEHLSRRLAAAAVHLHPSSAALEHAHCQWDSSSCNTGGDRGRAAMRGEWLRLDATNRFPRTPTWSRVRVWSRRDVLTT